MPNNDQLPVSGQDVRAVQDLGIMDKFKMVKQGLDPSNPDHIKQYQTAQNMNQGGVVGYADGGQIPQQIGSQAPIQGVQPQMQTQPMQSMDQQKQMQMDALKKLRGF